MDSGGTEPLVFAFHPPPSALLLGRLLLHSGISVRDVCTPLLFAKATLCLRRRLNMVPTRQEMLGGYLSMGWT